jgi:nucleoside-diphosphate-sugar epimerase
MADQPTALVTGGSGFIGGHLVAGLLAEGFRVRCLVRDSSPLDCLPRERITLCRGDLADTGSLARAVEGADWIFHLAGLVTANRREDFFRVNREGTRILLRAAADGAPRLAGFIYLSSLSAAGPSPDGRLLTEEDEPRPVSAYGESKLAAEREAAAFADRFPVTLIRPPAVYGPREKEIYRFLAAVSRGLRISLSWEDLRFSIIHVEDLVRALIAAVRTPGKGLRTYFVSDGKVYSWNRSLIMIAEMLGRRTIPLRVPGTLLSALVRASGALFPSSPAAFYVDKIREMAQKYWLCSAEKARRELNFTPRFALKDGMAETIRWYRENHWIS